jgi:hypothetical protein
LGEDSIAWIETPLAVETGEKCIAALERSHDLWVMRSGEGPASAAGEEAPFFGEIGGAVAIDDSMKADDSVFESIPEEMIENILRRF